MPSSLLKDLTDSNMSIYKKTLILVKAYFLKSEQKKKAWLYLIKILSSVIVLVGFSFAFSWWFPLFWTNLAAKAVTAFFINLAQFAGLVLGSVATWYCKTIWMGKLGLLWREWLTDQILDAYFKKHNYLKLARLFPEIKNIEQRAQEDIRNFVTLSLEIVTELFNAVLSLATFSGTLWVAGGALAIGFNIVIPGYMFWAALIAAGLATAATHLLARSLKEKAEVVETAEANFRRNFGNVTKNVEAIALERAEINHQKELRKLFKTVYEHSQSKLHTESRLVGFQKLYMQLAMIIPYLLAAPSLFNGNLGVEDILGVGVAFGEVSYAFSSFVNLYKNITDCQTSIKRIVTLCDAMQNTNLKNVSNTEISLKKLTAKRRKFENKNTINIVDLTTYEPFRNIKILKNLSLQLKPGRHTCIAGEAGMGKSTLFKVLCGTWKFGHGKIFLPSGKSMCFLPQTPSLKDNCSVRELLAFPDDTTKYSTKEYRAVLRSLGFKKIIKELKHNEKKNWDYLSGGQKQLIAFARALLKKPDWLFLDEATSSMDPKNEARAYRAIKKYSPKTTVVSIAHKETVRKFHDRNIYLWKDKNGNTRYDDSDKIASCKAKRIKPRTYTPSNTPRASSPRASISSAGFFSPSSSRIASRGSSIDYGSDSEHSLAA